MTYQDYKNIPDAITQAPYIKVQRNVSNNYYMLICTDINKVDCFNSLLNEYDWPIRCMKGMYYNSSSVIEFGEVYITKHGEMHNRRHRETGPSLVSESEIL